MKTGVSMKTNDDYTPLAHSTAIVTESVLLGETAVVHSVPGLLSDLQRIGPLGVTAGILAAPRVVELVRQSTYNVLI